MPISSFFPYVGERTPGGSTRALFDDLTHGQVRWRSLPDRFDQFVYPDLTVAVSSNPECYPSELIQLFPAEDVAIRR
ncbi:MAG: hypothetical protein ACK5QW_03650 [Cyanobacteriota bacterium]|jgi:all-trans-retinol 13,14-reductase